MMGRLITSTALLLVIVMTGCYYDTEETLYPQGECITTNISYVEDIAPIIQQNCFSCHSAAVNTANITLEGHAKLAGYALNGQLLGVIRHSQGYIAMPQGAAKLSDCNIAKIEAWAMDGALNN